MGIENDRLNNIRNIRNIKKIEKNSDLSVIFYFENFQGLNYTNATENDCPKDELANFCKLYDFF